MNISKIAYSLIIAIAAVIILIYGKSIILPFVLAVMVWFLIKAVRNIISKINIKGKQLPRFIKNIISFLIIFSALFVIGDILANNIINLSKSLSQYQNNVNVFADILNNRFNINIGSSIKEFIGDINFVDYLKKVLNSISELFSTAFMILLYVLFLLIEEAFFSDKLKAIFDSPEKFEHMHKILSQVNHSLNNYIQLKTLVSIITGAASFAVLKIIGIDSAFFWAFLIFVLNFIPTIGSLIATLFPTIMALLQTGDVTTPGLVLVSIGAIQVLVGNIIEPRIMGSSLNISSLVVLIALTFWGTIWGIAGMVLSVPITVMLIIIFAQFDTTKNIAILLSENGKIKHQ